MSDAAAKRTRREIRRAVGPVGLAAVNEIAVLVHETVLPQIATLTGRVLRLAERVEALETAARAMDADTRLNGYALALRVTALEQATLRAKITRWWNA